MLISLKLRTVALLTIALLSACLEAPSRLLPTERLEATWVIKGTSIQALNGQVMITAIESSTEKASLRITLPNNQKIAIDNMDKNSRRTLKIGSWDYHLDLLNSDNMMGARVALTPSAQNDGLR